MKSLSIASVLAWVIGVLGVFFGIAVMIPMVVRGDALAIVFSALFIVIGIFICMAAYGIGKKKRKAGIMAIVFGAVNVFFAIPGVTVSMLAIISLALNAALIILVFAGWKELK